MENTIDVIGFRLSEDGDWRRWQRWLIVTKGCGLQNKETIPDSPVEVWNIQEKEREKKQLTDGLIKKWKCFGGRAQSKRRPKQVNRIRSRKSSKINKQTSANKVHNGEAG